MNSHSQAGIIGRDRQVADFESIVAPDAAKWVMLVDGISGTGKTVLMDWLRSKYGHIPSASLALKPGLNAFDLIVELVSSMDARLAQEFARRVRALEQNARSESLFTYSPTVSQQARLGGTISESSQNAGLSVEFGSLASHVQVERQARRLDILVETLAHLKGKTWVLFVDETEHLNDPSLRNFIFNVLLRRLHVTFSGFRLYMSGQKVPYGEFPPHECLRATLEAFSAEDTNALLQRGGVHDRKIQEAIFALTGGHPLLVAMCINDTTLTAGDLRKNERHEIERVLDEASRTRWIYERVLARFEDSAVRDVAANLVLLDWFDLSLIRSVFGAAISDADFHDLVASSFIKGRAGGKWCCHELIRMHLRPHRWEVDPDRCRTVHRQAFSAYRSRISEEEKARGEPLVAGRLDYASAALTSALAFSADEAEQFSLSELSHALSLCEEEYLLGLARWAESIELPERLRHLFREIKLCLGQINLRQFGGGFTELADRLASHALITGDLDAAVILLHSAARACIAAGKPKQAVGFAKRLVEARDDLSDHVLMAEAIAVDGAYEEGLQLLGAAKERFGDSIEIRLAEVRVNCESGKNTDPTRAYAEAITDFPDDCVDARLLFAAMLFQREEYDAALEQLEAVLREEPENRDALLGRVDALIHTGRVHDAVKELPDVAQHLALIMDNFAALQRQLRDPVVANRLAAEMSDDMDAIPIGLAFALIDCFVLQGNVETVDSLASAITCRCPEASDVADVKRATVRLLTNDVDAARQILEPLTTRDTQIFDAYFVLAACHGKKGNTDDEREALGKVSEMFAGLRDIVDSAIALTFAREDRNEEALAYLEKTETKRRLGPNALVRRADLLVARGESEQAKKILETIVYTTDRSELPLAALIAVRATYAHLLIQGGQQDEAAELADRLVESFQDVPEALTAAAQIYLVLRDEHKLREISHTGAELPASMRIGLVGRLATCVLERHQTVDALFTELRLHPDRMEYVAALDQLVTKKEMFTELEGILVRGEEVAPGMWGAWISLQAAARAELGPAGAAQLRSLSESHPDDPGILFATAEALREQGDLKEARKVIQTLAKSKPELSRMALAWEIGALIRTKQLDEAEDLLGPMLTDPDLPRDFVGIIGELHDARDDAVAAISFHKRVAERFPDLRRVALVRVADALIETDKHADALGVIDKLEEEAPLDTSLLITRAQALRGMDRMDDALLSLRQIEAMANIATDLRSQVLELKGDIYQDAGRLDEAVATYRAATDLTPRQATLHLELSRIWKKQEKWSQAYEALATTIALQPERFSRFESELRELRSKARTT